MDFAETTRPFNCIIMVGVYFSPGQHVANEKSMVILLIELNYREN